MASLAGGQGVKYDIDIVFCIDATGSMTPIIDKVRRVTLGFDEKVRARFSAGNKNIGELRVRVVEFGDFCDGPEAIKGSEFFMLPDQKDAFASVVNGIDIANKGGDIPENGLEALYEAMHSDWVVPATGNKCRHIIVVLTDAVPLNLKEREGCVGYSDEYPSDIYALEDIWNEKVDLQSGVTPSTKMRYNDHRLVLFVPSDADEDGRSWQDVMGWAFASQTEVKPGEGCDDIDMDGVIEEIFKSA